MEENFFREIDASFINFDEKSDAFHWQSSDIVVQWEWILPIPVSLPGTILSYSFSTTFGDIAFGIQIVYSADDRVEDIISLSRVRSDLEAITGTFKVPREGLHQKQ